MDYFKEYLKVSLERDRYREALEFYASPLGWTRSRMEIGSEVMQGDSPCECDRGSLAREVLNRLALAPEA